MFTHAEHAGGGGRGVCGGEALFSVGRGLSGEGAHCSEWGGGVGGRGEWGGFQITNFTNFANFFTNFVYVTPEQRLNIEHLKAIIEKTKQD